MNIFLSYPSQERATAERIHFALGARGHEVFYDREDLAAGHEYDQAIARGIEESDLFIFLITPDALERGRYTMTELKLAQERWPHPKWRVLPVLIEPTPLETIPAYLRAVGLLEPHGDVAAEVAHEASRLLERWRLDQRLARAVVSPAGIAGVLLVGALGVVTWHFWPRSMATADGATAAETRPHGVPIDATVGPRARLVTATPEGYAVLASGPAEVVRFDANDRRLGEAVSLPGEPVAVKTTPNRLLVATRAPDGIAVIDLRAWSVTDTIPLKHDLIDLEGGAPVSTDIVSIELVDAVLWVVTGERAGEPAVLRLRLNREWAVATRAMTAPPAPGEFDARGLRLHTIGRELWAVTTATSPASFYRIMGTVRVDEVSGRENTMVSCAQDVATSANGRMLFLSCDNELQEVLAAGRDLELIGVRPTLPSESGPGNWTSELIEVDGATVFVAMNTETGLPYNRPAHARIARVHESSTTLLMDEPDAVITSLAVTPRSVIAVLRRADGTSDAVRVDRGG